jgi:hypothetical protein
LRERIGSEEWGAQALAVVDSEDPAIEPLLDDLRSSVAQLRRAPDKNEALRILARAFDARHRLNDN